MVLIRRYRSDDAQAVSDLIRLTMERSNRHDYSLDRLRPLIDYFSPAKVDELNLERYCLVAMQDAVLIGTAALEGARLCTFFVHPDHQRQGVGTHLLAAIELAAQDLGLNRLIIGASLTGAPFYEQRGYRQTGRILNGVAGVQIEIEKSWNAR